ncbi:Rpn family recombination-promoting nuclease/putative transposase [Parapedobacter deserti]|uniref:Rpn family recombination-promoting nuclease/putative transposase n=1 Tax=Parapedobacter deserti TaxID=1912957 RepID=A0ABV7JIC7_9SPHI
MSMRKDGKGSVDISLLVEHKSRPDKYTPVQVGGYIFSGYQQQIEEGRKQLSPIIPILFYHGEEKWEYWTLDRLFADLESELLGFLPKFDYLYSNLRDASDEEIRALDNHFLVASLLSLKHAHDKAWLGSNFSLVMTIGLANVEGYLGQELVVYCLHQAELSPEEAKRLTKKLPKTIRRQVMSTYELLKAEGKAEGFELGAEQKSYEVVSNLLAAGKFTVAEIANFATVTEDFVEKVRADLDKKKKK